MADDPSNGAFRALPAIRDLGSIHNMSRRSYMLSSLACKRCRRLKKKCDRVVPTCAACKRAGASCNFPDPSDSVVNHRMAWLSAFVDSMLPGGLGLESLQTGTDLRAIIHNSATVTPTGSPLLALGSPLSPAASRSSLSTSSDSHGRTEVPRVPIPIPRLLSLQSLPSGITPMTLIEAYFGEYHRTFPTIDKDTFITEAEVAVYLIDQQSLDISLGSVRLYLMMAIGWTILVQSNKISEQTSTKFPVLYHNITQLCLGSPSLLAIQVLLFLTLYSLHDPDGWSPWTLVTILVREAITLGINHSPDPGSQMSRSEVESRRRLFWSVFSMDRVISVAFGLPFALDETYQVPLPRITTDEFASQSGDNFLTLQITRHSIALRELDGQLFARIHLDSGADIMDERQYRRMTEQLNVQVENWYTQGCLNVRTDTHEAPTHNTISWLTANYHRLLALLHCPSQISPRPTPAKLVRLQQLVQKYAECLHVQFQDGHLPFNRITEARLLVIHRLLLHSYTSTQGANSTGLEDICLKCAAILGGYGSTWGFARRSRDVFLRFLDLIKKGNSNAEPQAPNSRDGVMDAIMGESEALIRDALSSSSAYNYLANERRAEAI